MTTITIITIIYLLSVWRVRTWVLIAHSDKGKWKLLSPDTGDTILTLVPFMNTIMAITTLFTSPYKDNVENFNDWFWNNK